MLHPELSQLTPSIGGLEAVLLQCEWSVGDRLFATMEKSRAAKRESAGGQDEVQPAEWNRVGDRTNTPLKGIMPGSNRGPIVCRRYDNRGDWPVEPHSTSAETNDL